MKLFENTASILQVTKTVQVTFTKSVLIFNKLSPSPQAAMH